MSSTVTSVFTFKVESTFDEWAAIFDSKEATRRHREFNIQPCTEGSDDDPQKIVVIHQHPEGNIEKFIEANGTGWRATESIYLQ